MNLIRKTDRNQAEIVDALRAAGASVYLTHTLGRGFPDLLVSVAGVNLLMEVKFGKATLSDDEQRFFAGWRGQVDIVRSVEDALRLLYLAKVGHGDGV